MARKLILVHLSLRLVPSTVFMGDKVAPEWCGLSKPSEALGLSGEKPAVIPDLCTAGSIGAAQ